MAQGQRAGLITLRSLDQNQLPVLVIIRFIAWYRHSHSHHIAYHSNLSVTGINPKSSVYLDISEYGAVGSALC
jgi:hypothetical protein